MQRNSLPSQLKNGLVLWLPGDVSGTTAYDASGSGNNGTLVNTPTSVRRQGYKGFGFNRTNQYITFSSHPLNETNCSVGFTVVNTYTA